MALSKENLVQLISLQEKDAALDKVKSTLDQIPVMVANLKAQLEADKSKAAEIKSRVIALEKKKKEKELELAQKEEAAKKHGAELNTVKTNEAFKALQTEIGFAKQAASEIETEILTLMDQIDAARKEEKAQLAQLASEQKEFEGKISEHEKRLAEEQAKFDGEKGKRDEAAAPIPKDAMKIYEHVRKRGKLNAVVPIDGSTCSACRISLAPTVIVEATKAKSLVTCESCQRIIYRPEVLAAKAA